MSQKITLEAWAAEHFDPQPSKYTLRRWARDCWIWPLPQKVGRTYYVEPNAEFVGSNNKRAHGSAAA